MATMQKAATVIVQQREVQTEKIRQMERQTQMVC